MELGIKIFVAVGIIIILGIIMINPLSEIPQDNIIYDDNFNNTELNNIFKTYTQEIADADTIGNFSSEADPTTAQKTNLFTIGRLIYTTPSFIIRLGNFVMNSVAQFIGVPYEIFIISMAIIGAIALYYFMMAFRDLL
jgi:hypothetical protein